MKRWLRLAPVAFVVAPNPAWAANDIGCVVKHLDPAAIDRIGKQVASAADRIDDSFDWLAGDRGAVIAARDACRKNNGWSNAATDMAMNYLEAQTALVGIASRLSGEGLDASAIRKEYAAMPLSDRRSIVMDGKIMSPLAVKLVNGLARRSGIGAVANRRANMVLTYLAVLCAIEFYPADFVSL